jgi:signal transduction histidine kinase
VRPDARDKYLAWLWGEVLLLGLLAASLVLFASNSTLPSTYELPELRLVLRTAILLAGVFVAVLAGARFTVEGHRLDLLLACGFFVAAANVFAFSILPVIDGDPTGSREEWADVAGRTISFALVAAAPFAAGRVQDRARTLWLSLGACTFVLAAGWVVTTLLGDRLPDLAPAAPGDLPLLLTLAFSVQSLLNLVALIGFGFRFRNGGEDLHRWLAVGSTFLLFASLHRLFTPLVSSIEVSHADFLRVLGYIVLLVGVWRAIRSAEFGRAVAEERARIAREIHDGLAQYLFAVSAQASMLEKGADPAKVVPQLRESAAAAQREARFAILALSSASGEAPFDAALRQYVELLTADGALEVDLEIDPATRLGADEQIELFRIVQEGLANVRKHAGARRAEVRIGRRGGQRVVSVSDDGAGFDGEPTAAGQGLRNMRARAGRIGGALTLRSQPGRGTALEIVLR